MKNLRLLACMTALATLCACGQDPKPAEPQAQASAASATVMPQTASDASNASAPAAEQASAVASASSTLSAQGNSLSSQGSNLSAQGSGLSATETGFNGVILITGHTDSKGSDAYNQRLSLARAQAVKNWFEAKGLQQNYQLEGLGATRPIAPNTHPDGSDNPEGRAQNRRVEIIVNKTTQLGN